MLSERTGTQGKHGTRDSSGALSVEAAKLLKTQDAGYLRVVGERVRRQLEAAEKDMNLQDGIKQVADGDAGRKKLIFADSVGEQKQKAKLKARNNGDEEDEEAEYNSEFEDEAASSTQKSKKQLEAENEARKEMMRARKLKRRAAESRRKTVAALAKQHEDILAAERELEWQRGKMENSVGGVNKNGVKWKIRERKR